MSTSESPACWYVRTHCAIVARLQRSAPSVRATTHLWPLVTGLSSWAAASSPSKKAVDPPGWERELILERMNDSFGPFSESCHIVVTELRKRIKAHLSFESMCSSNRESRPSLARRMRPPLMEPE